MPSRCPQEQDSREVQDTRTPGHCPNPETSKPKRPRTDRDTEAEGDTSGPAKVGVAPEMVSGRSIPAVCRAFGQAGDKLGQKTALA